MKQEQQERLLVRATFTAPIERVFELIAHGERATEWLDGVLSAETLTPGPIGPGSRFRWRVDVAGLMRETTVQEVTGLAPNERIDFRTLEGVAISGSWLFSHIAGKTHVTYDATISYIGGRPRRMAYAVMRGQMERRLNTSLDRLRALVEGTPG